jgi:hypothetical protein
MRLNTFVLAFVAAATSALTGCAADASEPTETPDSTEQATTMDDRAHTALRHDQVDVAGRGGVAVADQFERRMYDFSATPRIGQREQYEVILVQLNNASIIPHSGQAEGRDIALGAESGLGTTSGQ